MRFKINLSLPNPNLKTLPLNYQYELSAYIYRTIANGDAKYAEWLHQNGFKMEGKQFRLFTFSNFIIPQKTIDKEHARLIIRGNSASFIISFLPERSTEEFVKGIFADQHFSIGNHDCKAEFLIQNIELLPQPDFCRSFTGTTISPICITLKNDNGKLDYIAPDSPLAPELIKNNLLNKYFAFYGKPYDKELFFVWKTLDVPRSKLITIKTNTPQQTKVRGFHCKFSLFTIPELMNIAYNAGIGEKNSMGFGMVEEIGKGD
jgi:CRISPR-associated endoribonuclease Cas6